MGRVIPCARSVRITSRSPITGIRSSVMIRSEDCWATARSASARRPPRRSSHLARAARRHASRRRTPRDDRPRSGRGVREAYGASTTNQPRRAYRGWGSRHCGSKGRSAPSRSWSRFSRVSAPALDQHLQQQALQAAGALWPRDGHHAVLPANSAILPKHQVRASTASA